MRKMVSCLLVFGLISGCANMKQVATAKFMNAGGIPVSEAHAGAYPDIVAFIKGNLDNLNHQTDGALSSQTNGNSVIWKAFVFDIKSEMQKAKKPKADIETYCKASGGSFSSTVKEIKLRDGNENSPLIAAMRAQAFAYSKGASEELAQQTFQNAYQSQLEQNYASSHIDNARREALDIANKIIKNGLAGVYSCDYHGNGNNWATSIDVVGFLPKAANNTLDSHTIYMKIQVL
jgi:hypothetical protein